jgi:hypothetical protein
MGCIGGRVEHEDGPPNKFVPYDNESEPKAQSFAKIADQYETLDQVQAALRKSGLESSNRILLKIIIFLTV